MNIELRELMSENEMLSHIFLGCIKKKDLLKIKEKFVGDIDWQNESAKIPVQMKIAGVSVNPKAFFESWQEQMDKIIKESAEKLVAEKYGVGCKLQNIMYKIADFEQIISSWESEINWDIDNPISKDKNPIANTPENVKYLSQLLYILDEGAQSPQELAQLNTVYEKYGYIDKYDGRGDWISRFVKGGNLKAKTLLLIIKDIVELK